MNDLQYMYVVSSVPVCTVILFTVVHRSIQREFMFVVNKGVFFLLHNALNKLELQRPCSKNVKHTYSVSCTVTSLNTVMCNFTVFFKWLCK